jgi:hypothetical protein
MDLADTKKLKELEKENAALNKKLAATISQSDWIQHYNTDQLHSRLGYHNLSI